MLQCRKRQALKARQGFAQEGTPRPSLERVLEAFDSQSWLGPLPVQSPTNVERKTRIETYLLRACFAFVSVVTKPKRLARICASA